jgi:hypothetical protein
MQFAQIYDRVEIDSGSVGPIDLSAFPGTWINSNPDTSGIARILISESAGKLSLQTYAISPEGLSDWGTTEAAMFTVGPSSRLAAGFTCGYDFGFAETRLQGMIMKGLLVLAQFHTFKDNSGRADYFGREYFAVVHGRY